MSFQFQTSGIRSIAPRLACLLCVGLTAAGCHSHAQSNTVAEATVEPHPSWSDTTPCNLGIESGSFQPSQSTHVLGGELRAIQPPCAIAIARVSCDGTSSEKPLQIEPIAPERSAFWNQLVSDLPGVREITVLRTLSMDPRGIAVKDLLREARNQECNLCLVFAIDESDPNSAAVRAVLWDAETGTPRVAFNSSIHLPPSAVEKVSDDSEMRQRRDCDASYQVEGTLRQLVRDTLWDMAAKSSPGDGPTTRPNPWKSDQPILPRDDYRYRRSIMRSGL